MKKLILLLFTFSFSLFTCSAQSWFWVQQEVNKDSASVCDPLAIAVDKSGNIYQTGLYLGGVTFGSKSLVSTGSNGDAFITKTDPSGNEIWAISSQPGKVPLSGGTLGLGIATDPAGDVIITGQYDDTAEFGTTILPDKSYGYKLFVAKCSSSGSFLWATTCTGQGLSSSSNGQSVATDNIGNIYVTGYFTDSITMGTNLLTSATLDMFIAKYSSTGAVLWAQCPKEAPYSTSQGSSVAVDNAGNVYVAGLYDDTISIGPYPLPYSNHGRNVFLVKYSPAGIVDWVRTGILNNANYVYEGNFSDAYIAADGVGNIYLAGAYNDTIGFGPYSLKTGPGKTGIFLVKYTSAGNVTWARTGAGNNYFYYGFAPYSLSVNKTNDKVYMCGTASDTISFGSITLTSDSSLPSFLMKLDSSGNVLCGTLINNYNDDNNSVVADPLADDAYFNGDIFGIRCAFGTDTLKGSWEYGYLAKWSCACNLNATINSGTTICDGGSVQLGASGGITYSWQPITSLNYSNIANPIASPSVTTTLHGYRYRWLM